MLAWFRVRWYFFNFSSFYLWWGILICKYESSLQISVHPLILGWELRHMRFLFCFLLFHVQLGNSSLMLRAWSAHKTIEREDNFIGFYYKSSHFENSFYYGSLLESNMLQIPIIRNSFQLDLLNDDPQKRNFLII